MIDDAPVARAGRLPKVIGSDTELGNALYDERCPWRNRQHRAARALLEAVDGIAARPILRGGQAPDPQDVGRRYLRGNGGCCYVDLDHFELCTPETESARAFTAAWQAMLRIARQALADANARCPAGQRIEATVNNSDGNGSSWGGHLSLLVSRRLFERLCLQPQFEALGYLVSFQTSSIVYAGAGKLGAENDRAPVPYQISQRADFFETLLGPQTTFNRPLVNTRDEALCGPSPGDAGMARLHVIFYDTTLAPVATYLKAGVLQLVLAMLEAGWAHAHHHVRYPLWALHDWSRDPLLEARAELLDGRRITALEHQRLVLEDVERFVDSGEAEPWVPEAAGIVALWRDTLDKLAHRAWPALGRRLDWVARRLLVDAAVQRNGIAWDSPEARHLGLLYANLDPRQGLYWALESAGLVEPLIDPQEVRALVSDPPPHTRAWTRAMLLRRAGPAAVDAVDWDRVRLRVPGPWPATRTVVLPNPFGHTREQCAGAFAADAGLTALLDLLGADAPAAPTDAGAAGARPAPDDRSSLH